MIAYGMLILGAAIFSVLAGMQGLGVGFVVLPFLAFTSLDFTTQVQPLVLLLNGLAALLILLTSENNAQIEVKKTTLLIFSGVMGAFAGAYFLRFVLDRLCFVFFLYVYSLIVFYLLPGYSSGSSTESKNYLPIVVSVFLLSIFAGVIGVGPGYLLMPLLVTFHVDLKRSVKISLLIEIAASLMALSPHIATANWDSSLTLPLVFICSLCAFIGVKFYSHHIIDQKTRLVMALSLIGMAVFTMTKFMNSCQVF
jgi:hypothetical protein